MKTKKHFSLLALLLMLTLNAVAQMQDPVKFTTQLKTGSGPEPR